MCSLFHLKTKQKCYLVTYSLPVAIKLLVRNIAYNNFALCNKIRKIKTIDNWETVKSLEPFHIWDEATIRDRFEWSKNGDEQPFISLAILRVYKLAQVIEFPYEKKFGGCRSWLDVPVFNEDHIQSSQPVIEDQKFEILFSQLNKD